MGELGKTTGRPVRLNRRASPVADGKSAAENLPAGDNNDGKGLSIHLRSCSIQALGKEPWNQQHPVQEVHLLMHLLSGGADYHHDIGSSRSLPAGRDLPGCAGQDRHDEGGGRAYQLPRLCSGRRAHPRHQPRQRSCNDEVFGNSRRRHHERFPSLARRREKGAWWSGLGFTEN